MARGACGKVKPEKPPEAALFSLQESWWDRRQAAVGFFQNNRFVIGAAVYDLLKWRDRRQAKIGEWCYIEDPAQCLIFWCHSRMLACLSCTLLTYVFTIVFITFGSTQIGGLAPAHRNACRETIVSMLAGKLLLTCWHEVCSNVHDC